MYINVTIVNQFDYAVCLDWLRMKQKHIVKKNNYNKWCPNHKFTGKCNSKHWEKWIFEKMKCSLKHLHQFGPKLFKWKEYFCNFFVNHPITAVLLSCRSHKPSAIRSNIPHKLKLKIINANKFHKTG